MTTPASQLGRLETVDLCEVWASEAGEFTPWLAQPENIALLGDAIGLELEVQAREESVGPFRADIVCRETATDNVVLIENQLQRTDHTHLGQLLTYAAGLKAVTIVWVAERFTDEHRAALNWLNDITDGRFNFFGLEIELWRIGNSDVAPRFTVVSKPNIWTKPPPPNVSSTQLVQQEYWAGLKAVLLERKSLVKPTKPLMTSWYGLAIGRANFWITAAMNTQKKWIQVSLSCGGSNSLAHFGLLKNDRSPIEMEMGCDLMWEELPGKKEKRVSLRREDFDPMDRTTWAMQHAWLAEYLDKLYRVFAPRVKQLNADDYQDFEEMESDD